MMMNMKTSQTDLDNRDIENKISIVMLSIDMIERQLEICTTPHATELVSKKLKKEQENLKKLKNKYPEHFI